MKHRPIDFTPGERWHLLVGLVEDVLEHRYTNRDYIAVCHDLGALVELRHPSGEPWDGRDTGQVEMWVADQRMFVIDAKIVARLARNKHRGNLPR